MTPAQKVHRIVSIMNKIPGAIDSLLEYGERLERTLARGRDLYKRTHWGQEGHRRPFEASMPDTSKGIVVLGELVEITYSTRKGRDKELVDYHHEFDAPFPVLGFAPEGDRMGLVIVRDRGRFASKYTVNERGIVG